MLKQKKYGLNRLKYTIIYMWHFGCKLVRANLACTNYIIIVKKLMVYLLYRLNNLIPFFFTEKNVFPCRTVVPGICMGKSILCASEHKGFDPSPLEGQKMDMPQRH